VPRKRGLGEYVPMSQPMQIIKSRIEEIEDLGQPIESPKPPPPPSIPTGAKQLSRARTPARQIEQDEDPYKPEHYEIEIFRLMEETIEGRKKPARFTVLDNALDVIREQLDVYGYAIYTVLYRYSYGYNRSTCALSYGQIAKELKISSKKAELVLADLESRGLIEVLFPPFKKLRGKVYKVKLPREFVKENEDRLSRDIAFQELRRMGIL
jgi:hypothetical protein